jgi:toxin-antitoxin system PIN domain toxin
VIVVDANLLIHAVDRASPFHRAARRWWDDTLSGTTEVGLPWLVLLAYLRITTNPRAFERPLAPADALADVDSWLAQPYVHPLVAGPTHWRILRGLVGATGTAGNLTSDAHLAAIAIEHGATLCSRDRDFLRFPGLVVVDPIRDSEA